MSTLSAIKNGMVTWAAIVLYVLFASRAIDAAEEEMLADAWHESGNEGKRP